MSSRQSWARKFAVAFSGVGWALRNQNSFWIHIPMTAAVVGLALWLRLDGWRMATLALAITTVLSAELLNTAIELLVAKLHPDHDPQIGRALDVASAAVLVAAIGAVVVGLIALGPPLWLTLVGS